MNREKYTKIYMGTCWFGVNTQKAYSTRCVTNPYCNLYPYCSLGWHMCWTFYSKNPIVTTIIGFSFWILLPLYSEYWYLSGNVFTFSIISFWNFYIFVQTVYFQIESHTIIKIQALRHENRVVHKSDESWGTWAVIQIFERHQQEHIVYPYPISWYQSAALCVITYSNLK